MNRVRRKLKWDDVSSFVASDELTNVLLDMANESKRDVLENHEWDFDLRNDGVLKTVAPVTIASGLNKVLAAVGSPTVVLVGNNSVSALTSGSTASRLAITSDANLGETYFRIVSVTHPASDDVYVIEMGWPGAAVTALDTSSAEIVTCEYTLPTTVRDVLSVMVEQDEVLVEFVDKVEHIDRLVTNPFDTQSDQPEVCFVGGLTTPTVAAGTGTPATGLWLYPAPSRQYVVRYTYRYRHPTLSAITDTLQVPDHVVDLVVDLTVARAMRSRVAPDPEMAQQIEVTTNAKLARSVKRTGSQPLERMTLRSHDRRGGGMSMGGKPANSRIFYQP